MDSEIPKKRFKQDPDSSQFGVKQQQQQKQPETIITLDDERETTNNDTIDDKSKIIITTTKKQENNNACPYLDTIDRKALDFDFEKLCSVSLSKVNVYACLVCGKYFQGRGKSTHAFTHSINQFHHIYLNLETHKFYCLPDNYELQDPSLQDILYVLKPTFDQQVIDYIDNLQEPVKAYDGKLYYPGIVGLNNLKFNDYCNVIFQALSHVKPFRDYFIIESNYTKTLSKSSKFDGRHLLLQRFGELVRKLWNPRNFKAHVSPHEMLQAIVLASKKKFEFTKQSDPIIFLGFFLNSLLGSNKDKKDSIINRTFQGQIKISTRLLLPNVATSSTELEPELVPLDEEKIDIANFIYLSLDLPAMPLFPKKDERGKLIKPRINIYDLFSKYDGKTIHHVQTAKECSMKRYEILKLPPYLIIYYKRFTKNTFFMEKNTHIVDFPIDNLNLTNFLVKQDEDRMKIDANDLLQTPSTSSKTPSICYSLIANIVHDGEPGAGKGTYRAHILHKKTGKWFELQDLYVTEVSDTTLITLSESYIQIWELKEG